VSGARYARFFGCAALCATPVVASAQSGDLTLPPRFAEPGETRLAERRAGDDAGLDEIIVVRESEWRLPDLGSTWRAEQEAEREPQRIEVTVLPLYDPEREVADFDPLRINPELQRVGFIELFRVRFGRRAAD
jgi:hypothetical protein